MCWRTKVSYEKTGRVQSVGSMISIAKFRTPGKCKYLRTCSLRGLPCHNEAKSKEKKWFFFEIIICSTMFYCLLELKLNFLSKESFFTCAELVHFFFLSFFSFRFSDECVSETRYHVCLRERLSVCLQQREREREESVCVCVCGCENY